ncbi:hypothetical protein CDAR_521721 [Caerostris darwini]|uniref:Uncharacterized protein n=1 Tax=Caerostris darwini TaxID=1538125 RepID=A0AAV4MLP3_9ARAC|nr:hypothetical protein CDAR_521721 [Caerostris darwini]
MSNLNLLHQKEEEEERVWAVNLEVIIPRTVFSHSVVVSENRSRVSEQLLVPRFLSLPVTRLGAAAASLPWRWQGFSGGVVNGEEEGWEERKKLYVRKEPASARFHRENLICKCRFV